MTVIVWDGHTLAQDRLSVTGTTVGEVTKLRQVGSLWVAGTGEWDYVLAMYEWVRRGEKAEEWPEFQKTDEYAQIITLDPYTGVVREYGRTPYPYVVEGPCAWGSGRDAAVAAMAMGANAEKAALVACEVCNSCGKGVNTASVK